MKCVFVFSAILCAVSCLKEKQKIEPSKDDVYNEVLDMLMRNQKPTLRHRYTSKEERIYRILTINNLKVKEVMDPITGKQKQHLVSFFQENKIKW